MRTKEERIKQSFLRNEFDTFGRWNIPLVRKNKLDVSEVDLICYSDIKANDIDENKQKGVHFFIDDYRMERVYFHFDKQLQRLSQYKFLLTPDFSLYAEMPKAIQLYNVFRNRWCGAYWQSKGITVVPSISWSDGDSFSFCFNGVEQGSIVAIGMIGCKQNRLAFLRGYDAMIENINPTAIICFGVPFPEMRGNIVAIDYQKTRRVNRSGR